jgi:hypothetical protein
MKATCVFRGLAVALLLLAPVGARAKSAQRTARATTAVTAERTVKADKTDKADAPADKGDGDTASTAKSADGKTIKTKSYTFGAMDVEGKLKTPQLLYFLNRVKLELDMSAPDKRSFMKELARSAEDKNL